MIKAELINDKLSDLTVVNAARVSFDKTSAFDQYGNLPVKDVRLINYLARHNHWTPFAHIRETFAMKSEWSCVVDPSDLNQEQIAGMVWAEHGRIVRHSLWGWARLIKDAAITGYKASAIANSLLGKYPNAAYALGLRESNLLPPKGGELIPVARYEDPAFIDVTMRETVPIFVARQRFKHMIGFVYNEVSRRYVDDDPEFHVPDVWRKRADNKKQGSSDEAVDVKNFGMSYWTIGENTIPHAIDRFLNHSADLYHDLIEHEVAPEQARMVLPQSMLTSYYVTGNLTSWARAYSERSQPDAQAEIRELARQWDEILSVVATDRWI